MYTVQYLKLQEFFTHRAELQSVSSNPRISRKKVIISVWKLYLSWKNKNGLWDNVDWKWSAAGSESYLTGCMVAQWWYKITMFNAIHQMEELFNTAIW